MEQNSWLTSFPIYLNPQPLYYSTKSTDLTSYENYPNFALINKWRLVKKDPSAALSEPVEPIVYWVENTTPEEIVPAVVAGIENWNIAFEEAGFKNAIVAKIQPKDATWDAADYDYNVVRWSSEPDGRLLGIGPSVSNPLTGEIISADIVNKLLAVKLGHNYRKLYGYTEDNDPLMQYITNLTLHEVGHTLGLRHNFRGSQLYSPTEIHNKDITGNTIMSSVMDYDPINIAPEGVEQGIFFSTVPGVYDKWAIKFGYTPNLSDEERKKINEYGLTIERLTGDALNVKIWDSFYEFYLSTIDKKWGGAYLTKDFFYSISRSMKNKILLVIAKKNNDIIAGALNFLGENTLYGRNWGSKLDIPFLHFELCYYQAIEYAIENKINVSIRS